MSYSNSESDSRNGKKTAVVFNDTRDNRHYGCDLVMGNLELGLRKHSLDPVKYYPCYANNNRSEWKEAIPKVDAIIVNGEGSIHDNSPRAKFLARLGPLSKSESIPAFLINASIVNNGQEILTQLKSYDRIYVRETGSRDELLQCGVNTDVVPDLSFYSAGVSDWQLDRLAVRNGVCATDSILRDVAKHLREYSRSHKWNYIRLRHFPLYYPSIPLLSDVWRRVDGRRWPPLRNFVLQRPITFARFLAKHELVVTGRFHGAAICLLTRTPFLAFESNTSKISSLLVDVFGSKDRLINHDELEQVRKDPRAFRWTVRETEQVEAYLQRAPILIDNMLTSISQDLSKKLSSRS